jgi:acyl dehydratase
MAEPGKLQDDGQRLYLEDLNVGRRFTSAAHLIDEAQIKAFAAQFDPQPFHLDDAAAKATLFGGLAASVADLTFLPALPRVLRRNVKPKATLESHSC